MEQVEEPHSFHTAEGARVYPPFHLCTGRTRTEAAGRSRPKLHRTADPAPRNGSSPGRTGPPTKRPTGAFFARQLGLPGREGLPGRDPAGLEHTPEKRGQQGPRETERRAGEGEALIGLHARPIVRRSLE